MNKFLKRGFLFIMMMCIVAGAAAFKETNYDERDFKELKLSRGAQVICFVDISKHGAVKKLFNNNGHTLYLKCKLAEPDKKLSCRLIGLDGIVSQGSKKGRWVKLSETDILKSRKGYVPVNLELNLVALKEETSKGKLEFYDGKKLYASVDIFCQQVSDNAVQTNNKKQHNDDV